MRQGNIWRTIAAVLSLSAGSYAQTYTVSGKVTACSSPVRNAVVTFVDNGNPGITYTAVTDTAGAYNLGSITGIAPGRALPAGFKLAQNYPNPFSGSTSISYSLGEGSETTVTIYDVLGREVRSYHSGYQGAGTHGVVWDGLNNYGRRVARGVYLYRLQTRDHSQTKKMLYGPCEAGSLAALSGTTSILSRDVPLAVGALLRGETFTVQVANTDSTSPVIWPSQFNNILVQSDTSLVLDVAPREPVVVCLDSVRQIIRGFGAANIVNWRPDMTAAQAQTAFGTADGQLGLTIMRLRIPPDSTQFKINIPSGKLAGALGVTLIATPWTPPAWMKTNHSTIGGSLDTNKYATFASYLKSFADTMAANGAPVYAISVQNEPDFNASYESCLWSGAQFLNFMRNNALAVGTPVFMPEAAGFNHSLSDPTLNDSSAAAHVAFVGGHLYGATPQTYPLAESKGKEVWMTEYLDTNTTWPAVLATAKQMSDCLNCNMSAYVWWYILRFYGPLNESGLVTKRGYVMSQFSKFVRPGYYRILTSAYSPQRNVYVTAYRSGTKVVVVALNMTSAQVVLPIKLDSATTATYSRYTTTEMKNCLAGSPAKVTDGTFNASLEASSVTTFVSN